MLRIFRNLEKKDWLCITIAVLFIVVQVWLDLKMPDYMSEITEITQTPGHEIAEVWGAGGKMLICALGSLLSAVTVSVMAARIATDFGAAIRRKLFSKVQSFSMEEISRFSTPSLITRTTNDIMQVQILIVMGLQSIIKAPILAVWAITKIAGKSMEWTITTGLAVGILLILVVGCVIFVLPKFRKLQSLTDDLNRVTRENLTGLRVVRAYNAEEYQEAKFDKANEELTSTHLFTGRIMAFMNPSIQFIMNGLSLAIFWLGAVLIENALPAEKIILFSDMIVFSQYAMQVVMAFMMLVMFFLIFPRASVSAERILEVMDTECSIKDGTFVSPKLGRGGKVEFRNVSFRYPGASEDVLHNISFTAHIGETIAIIGSTGCGKTTLLNLIPRFYDVTAGEVLVDGINVKEYTQKSLREKLGYVSQKATLFSGTIRENTAFGKGRRDFIMGSDVVESIYTAQAADFVEKLPDMYEGYVAQGGSNFSGGQKQRLSIARAVCRRPQIYLFDDSFSALDYKTDRKLRSQLASDSAGATKIIVAQRIGTIRDADQILVMDDGKIVGMGKHNELLRDCEVYRQIARSQLSEEELAV